MKNIFFRFLKSVWVMWALWSMFVFVGALAALRNNLENFILPLLFIIVPAALLNTVQYTILGIANPLRLFGFFSSLFTSSIDAVIVEHGLNPDFFKKLGFPGEYDLLIRVLRRSLSANEAAEADSFIKKASSRSLIYECMIDRLTVPQLMILAATINAAAEEGTGLGANTRAHAILFYIHNLGTMRAILEKDSTSGAEVIADMQKRLKEYYNKTQEECITNNKNSFKLIELNGLLYDVQYKFVIPN